MRANLELWTKEQGGRHTPVFDQFRPGFRAATEGHGDVDLGVVLGVFEDDRQIGTARVVAA
jgi:translation elongation factor EF-Tu-like GTPase